MTPQRPKWTSGERAETSRAWFQFAAPGSEYLEPEYYKRILKPYTFGGLSDLEMLQKYVDELPTSPRTILELGPGPGRATRILLRKWRNARYTGVDLSARMVEYCTRRFHNERSRGDWIVQDALSFLGCGDSRYDLIVSLWSISHAVHNSIARTGSVQEARSAVERMFAQRVPPGGRVYVIHFDSTSEEQKLALRQRQRLWPFLVPGRPSPSQQLLEEALGALSARGGWRVQSRKLVGDMIVYESLDEALESYMNFHMEGWFNHRHDRDAVLYELEADLLRRVGTDGKIRVRPGCVVFVAERL